MRIFHPKVIRKVFQSVGFPHPVQRERNDACDSGMQMWSTSITAPAECIWSRKFETTEEPRVFRYPHLEQDERWMAMPRTNRFSFLSLDVYCHHNPSLDQARHSFSHVSASSSSEPSQEQNTVVNTNTSVPWVYADSSSSSTSFGKLGKGCEVYPPDTSIENIITVAYVTGCLLSSSRRCLNGPLAFVLKREETPSTKQKGDNTHPHL